MHNDELRMYSAKYRHDDQLEHDEMREACGAYALQRKKKVWVWTG